MKYVSFIRHAEAAWQKNDHARHLTERGISDALHMGMVLKEQAVLVEKIFSSDAKRAASTADLINQSLSVTMSYESCLYACSSSAMMQYLRDIGQEYTAVALVGHNPAITEICTILTGESRKTSVSTCMVISVCLDIDAWQDVEAGCVCRSTIYTPPNYSVS